MPHILLVEDDADINNSTAAYLHRQGRSEERRVGKECTG